MSALRRLLERVRGAAPRPDGALALGGQRAPRRPRTALRTGPTVSALVLRGALLVLVTGAGLAVGDTSAAWLVAGLIGAAVAVRPHAALLAIAVAVLAGMLALSPGAWQPALLVLLTHAVIRLGAIADAVSWRGQVEVAVLRGALPAFLAVQLVAQAAVVLALVVDGAAPVPWLVVLAVTCLAALGWALVRDMRTRP